MERLLAGVAAWLALSLASGLGCLHGLVPASAAYSDPPGSGSLEESKREAVRHWNAGIIYYQQGDYRRARAEWKRCLELDPSNSDCIAGLPRVDQAIGPEPAKPDYAWIPSPVRDLLERAYPKRAVPIASVRALFGNDAFYRGMLEGQDAAKAYAVKGDFNGDGRDDYAVLLFPAQRTRDRLVLKLVAALSKPDGAGFEAVELQDRLGFDYLLTREPPGLYATAAAKGFASEPSDPHQLDLPHAGIGLHKMGSANSILWWDGKQFQRTFTSD